MRRKHYHVLVGLPGCMPDSDDVCQTLAEAQACAQWQADQYREDWDCDKDQSYYKVIGNRRDGYEVNRRDQSIHGMLWRESLPILISINDCYEEDCLIEDSEYSCTKCGYPLLRDDFLCHECGHIEKEATMI